MIERDLNINNNNDPLDLAISAFKAERLVDQAEIKAEEVVHIATRERYDIYSIVKTILTARLGSNSTKKAEREGSKAMVKKLEQYLTEQSVVLKTVLPFMPDKVVAEQDDSPDPTLLSASLNHLRNSSGMRNSRGLSTNIIVFLTQMSEDLVKWDQNKNEIFTFLAQAQKPLENTIHRNKVRIYTKMLEILENDTDLANADSAFKVPSSMLKLAKEASQIKSDTFDFYTHQFAGINVPDLERENNQQTFNQMALKYVTGMADTGNFMWPRLGRGLLFSSERIAMPMPTEMENKDFLLKVANLQLWLNDNILLPGLNLDNSSIEFDSAFSELLNALEPTSIETISRCIYRTLLLEPSRRAMLTNATTFAQTANQSQLIAQVLLENVNLSESTDPHQVTTTVYLDSATRFIKKTWPQIAENLQSRFGNTTGYPILIETLDQFCKDLPSERISRIILEKAANVLTDDEREQIKKDHLKIDHVSNTLIQLMMKDLVIPNDAQVLTIKPDEDQTSFANRLDVDQIIVQPNIYPEPRFLLYLLMKDYNVVLGIDMLPDGKISSITQHNNEPVSDGIRSYFTQLLITSLYKFLISSNMIPEQIELGEYLLNESSKKPVYELPPHLKVDGKIKDYIGEANSNLALELSIPSEHTKKQKIATIDTKLANKMLLDIFGD